MIIKSWSYKITLQFIESDFGKDCIVYLYNIQQSEQFYISHKWRVDFCLDVSTIVLSPLMGISTKYNKCTHYFHWVFQVIVFLITQMGNNIWYCTNSIEVYRTVCIILHTSPFTHAELIPCGIIQTVLYTLMLFVLCNMHLQDMQSHTIDP